MISDYFWWFKKKWRFHWFSRRRSIQILGHFFFEFLIKFYIDCVILGWFGTFFFFRCILDCHNLRYPFKERILTCTIFRFFWQKKTGNQNKLSVVTQSPEGVGSSPWNTCRCTPPVESHSKEGFKVWETICAGHFDWGVLGIGGRRVRVESDGVISIWHHNDITMTSQCNLYM